MRRKIACASGSVRDQARQGANDADHRRRLADDGNGGPRLDGQIDAARVKQEGDAAAVKAPAHQYAGLAPSSERRLGRPRDRLPWSLAPSAADALFRGSGTVAQCHFQT